MKRLLTVWGALLGGFGVGWIGAADFIWTGAGGTGNTLISNPANWKNNVAPTGLATDTLIFGLSDQGVARFPATPVDWTVGNIVFTGSSTVAWIMGNVSNTTVLTLAGGISSPPGFSWFGSLSPALALTAGSHALNIEGSSVYILGNVTGPGSLVKHGAGRFGITGNNTFAGGMTINQGIVQVGHDNALGTGTVTFNSGTLAADFDTIVTVPNNFLLGSKTEYGFSHWDNTAKLTLSGTIAAITTTATLDVLDNNILTISGNLVNSAAGASAYVFTGGGTTILTGNNTYTGGTVVGDDDGAMPVPGYLRFGSAAAIPNFGMIETKSRGFVGVTDPALLPFLFARLDPTRFGGLVGLDTPTGEPTRSFSGAIDFTALPAGARVGTITEAILTGAITPRPSSPFNFGGNGWLYLRSGATPLSLSGGAGLRASSFTGLYEGGAPFMLVLSRGNNTYSGDTMASGAGIIIDAPNALPAGSTLSLQPGSYLGHTENAVLTVPDLVSRLSAGTYSSESVLGFDSADLVNGAPTPTTRSVGDINLSSLAGPIFIGTASAAVLNGNITINSSSPTPAYNFTGYAGGVLTVNTTLSNIGGNATRVNVGLPYVTGENNGSEVRLMRNNTYTGGTILNGGELHLELSGGLGTGPLSVEPGYDQAGLWTGAAVTTLSNNIVLQTGDLAVHPLGSALALSGAISGTGHLLLKSGSISLSNASNSLSGGIDAYGPSTKLIVANNNATGTAFVYLDEGADLQFSTTAPRVHGLGGGYDYEANETTYTSNVTLTAPNTTLTIEQPWDDSFAAKIEGAAGTKIIKTGPGKLALSASNNVYDGGTEILQGMLEAGATGALGTGPIAIKGGSLLVAQTATLTNAITFGPGGGKLGGGGTFGGNFNIGTGIGLTPGNSTGTLTFTGNLAWGSGGSYDVEVQSATGGIPGLSFDTIAAGGLSITAISGDKFNLNLLSLSSEFGPGPVGDFNPNSAYSWQIVSTTGAGVITGFTPGVFNLNVAGFTNSLNGGFFSLSLGTAGGSPTTGDTALFLNFTPVPEPSTWVLLLSGLGVLLTTWIRRHRAPGHPHVRR